jgi:hypothetical protein
MHPAGIEARALVLLIVIIAETNASNVHYPNFPCFSSNTPTNETLNYLKYKDQSVHSVKIPYSSWASARVNAHIAHIILTEIMNYSVELVPVDTLLSAVVMNMVAGCNFFADCECSKRDTSHPPIHVTLESWVGAMKIAPCVPPEEFPFMASVLKYSGDDSYFLWSEVIEAGWNSSQKLALDYFRSYDANAFDAHVFFDPWQKLLELLPPEAIIPCSAMSSGSPNDRHADHYTAVTGDAGVDCHNDQVWISPSCRTNTTRCVPLMLQYFVDKAMQLAHFLNLPLAIVAVGPVAGSYAAYFRAARAGRFLFGYWSPDDLLVDPRGRLPVLLNLPRASPAEQARGVYRTGAASQQLRSYVWRELPAVDPQVGACCMQRTSYSGPATADRL